MIDNLINKIHHAADGDFALTGINDLFTLCNVAQNYVTEADTAPERLGGIFMPVFNGGSARNSLRVITPCFFCSILSSRRLMGLKSSLVGVLKRFTEGALIMNAINSIKKQSVKTYSEMTSAELLRAQNDLFRLAHKEQNNELSDAICNFGCDLSEFIASTPATSKDDVRAKLIFMLDYYVAMIDIKKIMPCDRYFFAAVRTVLEFLKEKGE